MASLPPPPPPPPSPAVRWATRPLERALVVRICMRCGQPDAARTPRTFARLLERIAREPRVPLALHRECVCLEVDSGDRSADSAVCHLCAWCFVVSPQWQIVALVCFSHQIRFIS